MVAAGAAASSSTTITAPALLRRLVSAMANPTVFFDVAADGDPLGRVTFEVGSEGAAVEEGENGGGEEGEPG